MAGPAHVFGRQEELLKPDAPEAPAVIEVYNSTGSGTTGVHYDPVFDAEVYAQVLVGLSDAGSSQGVPPKRQKTMPISEEPELILSGQPLPAPTATCSAA